MAVLGAGLFSLPGLGAPAWATIGLVSAGAVVLGAARYAVARPLAWCLLAAAILAMAAGDTLYGLAAHGGPDAAPAIADICYLAMFPLVMAGLVTLVRTGAGLPDWSRWLDVLTFMCAAALLVWVVLTGPAMATDQLSSAEKSSLAAYNLGDLLILVTTVRLVLAARRSAALILLSIGASGVLAGDVAYTLDQLHTGWRPGGPADAAYLLFYVCWGAAALQPSMGRIVEPAPARDSPLQARWAALLGLSLTIPPAILVGEAMTGAVRDAPVIGVVSGLMSALVVTRLVNALTQHRRALTRERALRQASGTLLSALTPDGVDAAIHEAIGTLLARGQAHGVVVLLDDDASVMRYPPPAVRRTWLVEPAELRPDLHHRLDDFPAVLVCPLGVEHGADSDDGGGALLVAADRGVLAAIEGSVEVLAAQASMALERIALTEQLNRRDSDHYLRTITQNSVDMVLIVDDSLHVRYASTSVAATFGLDLPVLVTLHDLEQGDDRGQISRTLAGASRSSQAEGARDWWYLRRADGSGLTVEVNCRDLRQDRTIRGYVITMRDITGQDAQRRELIQRYLESSPAGQNRRSSHNRFR